MTMYKVKKFVKEHKKELLIGGAGVLVGCVLAKNRISKFEYQTLKEMRKFGEDRNDVFGTLAGGIMNVSEGANCVNVFKANLSDNNKIADYAGYMTDYYKDHDPEITGMLVFTK